MLDKDLHVLVTKAEAERLRKEAFKKNVRISDIVRDGIKLYFEREKQNKIKK